MNILITGANRGLGLELTEIAVERGHYVIATMRDINRSQEQLGNLINKYPDKISIYPLDVVKEDDSVRLAETLKKEGKTIDALINNAGILLGRDQRLEDLSMEDVKKTFEINVFGPINIIKHHLPLIPNQKSSIIINISSEAGSITNARGGDYSYGMSKAALNMFSNQLKKYILEREIRVLAIHPGWMQTDMGGEKAPLKPRESAEEILSIIEGKRIFSEGSFFVNYKGENMEL
jgi:NAD(P)-dependent dehydrogenase (short-subunit alcohol dehydrogenase family)